ncbi:PAS domain S-box protein [Cereibacter sphaeroides]|uniref:PAS domain S-box protein n=1 Tax=Cereibacter sphaeroides TaxID=1063 RepID=UPI001F2636C2|nr:PAS domain S-box protein [Cereibacter sphaeroides]MCE6951288.1 PAS domain S-box protein [Cereibacter sphaeroides]
MHRTKSSRPTLEHAGRLHAIMASAVDGIIIARSDGVIETVNAAAARLFGYETAEFIGRNVHFLMAGQDRADHDQYLRNYMTTGVRKIIGIGREVVGRRKDGSLFPMHLSIGEFAERGERLFTAIIHDLTERNETARALHQAQKIEAIGQLTGGVAHDFNNLLAVIVGNVELLMLKGDMKPHAAIIDEILKAADLGASLTSQLLAFARRSPLAPRPIQVNGLISGLSHMLERSLGATVELCLSLDPDAWMVEVDPDQFQTAIINLAINARDAMPNGGRLFIETRNFTFDDFNAAELGLTLGHCVAVSITDTGCGMPLEIREKVFEPFFTTKPVGHGTGLGLSMVYGFTKQSGGEVTIYSEVGKGTTVTLFLSRHQSDPALDEPKEAPMAMEEGERETVLVVEDNDQMRKLTRDRLQILGYSVLEASNGPEALQLLDRNPEIALVFSDLVMPGGMSGYDLAQHVRDHHPGKAVLLTSGYAEELVDSAKLSSLRLKLLRKPYRQAQLAEAFREAINGG